MKEQPIDQILRRRSERSEPAQKKDLYDTKVKIMSLYESKMFNMRTNWNDRPTGVGFFAEFGV